jgi:8-oxo-dGTP diphosphatase
VHQVKDWDGEPHGAEGQPLAWVDAASLNEFQVPEANAEIMSRVKALLV